MKVVQGMLNMPCLVENQGISELADVDSVLFALCFIFQLIDVRFSEIIHY